MTREEMYGDLFLVRTGSIHPTSKKFVRMTVEILNVIDEYDALKRKVLKSSKNQKWECSKNGGFRDMKFSSPTGSKPLTLEPLWLQFIVCNKRLLEDYKLLNTIDEHRNTKWNLEEWDE